MRLSAWMLSCSFKTGSGIISNCSGEQKCAHYSGEHYCVSNNVTYSPGWSYANKCKCKELCCIPQARCEHTHDSFSLLFIRWFWMMQTAQAIAAYCRANAHAMRSAPWLSVMGRWRKALRKRSFKRTHGGNKSRGWGRKKGVRQTKTSSILGACGDIDLCMFSHCHFEVWIAQHFQLHFFFMYEKCYVSKVWWIDSFSLHPVTERIFRQWIKTCGC